MIGKLRSLNQTIHELLVANNLLHTDETATGLHDTIMTTVAHLEETMVPEGTMTIDEAIDLLTVTSVVEVLLEVADLAQLPTNPVPLALDVAVPHPKVPFPSQSASDPGLVGT